MPTVEEYGVEPIPRELQTAGWRDLFAINFTFFLNPVMYVLGGSPSSMGGCLCGGRCSRWWSARRSPTRCCASSPSRVWTTG